MLYIRRARTGDASFLSVFNRANTSLEMTDQDQMTAEERYKRLSAMWRGIPGMREAIEQASTERASMEQASMEEDNVETPEVDLEQEALDQLEAEILQNVEEINQQSGSTAPQPPMNNILPQGPVDNNLPDHVKQMIDGISAKLDPKFQMINDNVSNIGNRVEILEERVVKNNDCFKQVADYAVKSRNVIKDNRKKVKNLEVKVDNAVKEIGQRYNELKDHFSEKMIEIEDIVKRYEEGGFGEFSDLEKPTRKDQYDFMKSFNMSKNSVGLFPVYRADIEEMKKNLNCKEEDAYRVSISQFLRLEIGFTADYVAHIEQHYVEVRYDGRDTLYIIFDNIDHSAGRMIWQEAKNLSKHNLAGRQTPELRTLEVPQLRERKKAMERFANSLRHGWRAQNPDAPPHMKCRTRVLEAKDGSYDFIVQQKLPTEKDYKRVEIPDSLELPKIQWKVKTYMNHSSTVMMPRARERMMQKDFIPPGRETVHIPVSNPALGSATTGFTIHVINKTHKYVPGFVDPGSPSERSLDRASHDGSGRTPLNMVGEAGNSMSDGAGALGTGIGTNQPASSSLVQQQFSLDPPSQPIPQSILVQPSSHPPLRRPTPEEWSKAEEERQRRENERILKENRERQETERREKERSEAQEKLQEDIRKREEEIMAIIEENNRKDTEHEKRMEGLDSQLEEIRRVETEKEEKRYAEDIEKRRIALEIANDARINEEKRKREELELRNNPNKNLITDVDQVDTNGNQGNNAVVSPPRPETGARVKTKKNKVNKKSQQDQQTSGSQEDLWNSNDEHTDRELAAAASEVTLGSDISFSESMSDTMLAGNLTQKSVTKSQPNRTLLDFWPKRSSTIRDDNVATQQETDDETDSESFEDAPESPVLSQTPPRSRLRSTNSLLRDTLVKRLDFNSRNYELLPPSPSLNPDQTEVIKVIPSGAEGRPDSEVEVRVDQRPGVIGERIRDPSQEKHVRKVMRRYSTSGRRTSGSKIPAPRSRSNSLGRFEKSEDGQGVKRSGDKDNRDKDKVNRVKSPEKDSLIPEDDALALAETKTENVTTSSDLSSLSVLPDDSGITAALENAESDSGETLEETVILAPEAVTGGGMVNKEDEKKVTIVRDFSSYDEGTLVKPKTPEFDGTGHMNQIQATTPVAVIDSGVQQAPVMSALSLSKPLSKPLILASSTQVEEPNTEQKKKDKEEVD